MALFKSQHTWIQIPCVLFFDFSKAFDSEPNDLWFKKLAKLPIYPHMANLILSFLEIRQQGVVVDRIITEYLHINRGVPQGAVSDPVLFSVMAKNIKTIDPNNELVKFADVLTLGVLA